VARLTVSSISKSYGEKLILDGVGFEIEHGAFYALLGPSGSGKSTILRAIAGFVHPDKGRVLIDDRDVTGVAPERRNIGVVFQSYALFPHMSIFDNIAFGLRMRKLSRAKTRERVRDVLELVQLGGLGHRRPTELSGGQQQRVALARALVIEPSLLLLDEPLSALDRKIRQDVRIELKRIQRETGVTTLIVTHDQEEALFLADRLLVLDEGRVRQMGTPWDVYHRPVDTFVAAFLGSANLVPARVRESGGEWTATAGAVSFPVPAPEDVDVSGQLWLSVRPERVAVEPAGEGVPPAGRVPAVVNAVDFSGPVARVELDLDGVVLSALLLSPGAESIEPGARVWAAIDPRGIRYFSDDGREPVAG
jgi:ABC-type Fe3+/spermidine/putrescine transport system ATPase subunit